MATGVLYRQQGKNVEYTDVLLITKDIKLERIAFFSIFRSKSYLGVLCFKFKTNQNDSKISEFKF